MKRIIFLATVCCIVSLGSLKAQTEKGNLFIGVSSTFNVVGLESELMGIGYTTSVYKSDAEGFVEDDPVKAIKLNLAPKVGYFIADNFVAGLDNYLSFDYEKYSENDKFSTTIMATGPFVRYYLPTSKVKPFFEMSSFFGNIKFKDEFEGNTNEYNSGIISLGGGAGIAVPIGDRVTFDAMAGYKRMRVKDKEDNETNNRTVLGTVGLNIGFTVML